MQECEDESPDPPMTIVSSGRDFDRELVAVTADQFPR
jgi:hypothetical protein